MFFKSIYTILLAALLSQFGSMELSSQHHPSVLINDTYHSSQSLKSLGSEPLLANLLQTGFIQSDNLVIQNNNIEYNGQGVQSTVTINADNNWWGDASGPASSANPTGLGNSVSDTVSVSNWLPEPVDIDLVYQESQAPGPITIMNNNIEYNGQGVQSTIALNADNNWWGDASGPASSANPTGLGNPVSDTVSVSNWLPEPVDIGLVYQESQAPGPITIINNNIEYNGLGLVSTYALSAINNWWGDASGPNASSNPTGLGNSVSDTIDFTPWSTDPVDLAGQPHPLPDLSIESAEPVQALEGSDLVVGKASAIKVVVHKTGSVALSDVPVTLKANGQSFTNFYVADPANMDSVYRFDKDNSQYPLNFTGVSSSQIIYFIDSALFPTSSTYTFSVVIDEQNVILETNEANNNSGDLTFPAYITEWNTPWKQASPDLNLYYFRGDWGETDNQLFNQLYQSSNGFIKGVLPVSAASYRPHADLNYLPDSKSYQDIIGRMNNDNFFNWAIDTAVEFSLAQSDFDRLITVVPQGWFINHTYLPVGVVGVRIGNIPNVIAEAIPQLPDIPNGKNNALIAHEIGHSYNLAVGCEEYDACNPTRQNGIGNLAAPGFWVNEKIPMLDTLNTDLYCFMGMAADTFFWIDQPDYQHLLTTHKSAPIAALTGPSATQSILVSGIIHSDGQVDLRNWYLSTDLDNQPQADVEGEYAFQYLDATGSEFYRQPFEVSFTINSGGTTLTTNSAPFMMTIPFMPGTAKIVIQNGHTTLAERPVSQNAPQVTFLPLAADIDTLLLSWNGNDMDGDPLLYSLFYSDDDGQSWNPLVNNLSSTSYRWSTKELAAGDQYRLKVLATDGVLTGSGVSSKFQIPIQASVPIYLPLISSGK